MKRAGLRALAWTVVIYFFLAVFAALMALFPKTMLIILLFITGALIFAAIWFVLAVTFAAYDEIN